MILVFPVVIENQRELFREEQEQQQRQVCSLAGIAPFTPKYYNLKVLKKNKKKKTTDNKIYASKISKNVSSKL